MITVSNVKKHYSGFDLDCSIDVKNGMITGLIGRNGAGKTTLFKSILGLVYPDSGTIKLWGKDIEKITDGDKEKIGTVLSDSMLSGYITIGDAEKILKSFYPAFNEDWFNAKCRENNLDHRKKIKELSTGMKAKLNILSALSHNAEILILDEPTAGLDVIARDEIIAMLKDYMDGDSNRAILISSHISTDLESLCDDFYMIEDGKIILHEDTDILLSDYAVIKVNDEEYEMLDKAHLIRRKKEPFGYSVLTNQKKFYMENFPSLVIEKSGIDSLMELMIGGDAA